MVDVLSNVSVLSSPFLDLDEKKGGILYSLEGG